MATGKKFYWLKLPNDFFKRHDIRILKSQKNGRDYIIFYLTLLTESVTHEGKLRFSEDIPYSDEMLSTITDTDIDVVRSAMTYLIKLGLVSIDEEQTIYMNELPKMIGYETDWARKKRLQREKDIVPQLSPASPQQVITAHKEDIVPSVSPPCPPNVRQEIELEKEIDIDIKEKINKKKKTPSRSSKKTSVSKPFKKPSVDDIKKYCSEKEFSLDPNSFFDYYESCGWVIGKYKPMKDWKAACRNWEKREKEYKAVSDSNKPVDIVAPDWMKKYWDDLDKEDETNKPLFENESNKEETHG